MMTKRYYVVKENDDDKLVAVFTDENDCYEFMNCRFDLYCSEVVI